MHTRASPVSSVDSLTFRTYAGRSDLPVIGDLLRRASLHDRTEMIWSDAQIANEYAHPDGFDPTRDAFLAELGERVVAVGEVRYVRRDGQHSYQVNGAVHPEMRRQGIGRALMARLEARAAERVEELSDQGSVWLDAWMPDNNEGFARLIGVAGYEPVRHFFDMVRGDLDEVVEGPLPEGLQVRPVILADLRRIYDAEAEAFQDHWGRRDWTDATFAALLDEPDLDLSLWRVAWDDTEVAGVVTTWIIEEENAKLGLRRGWLGHVSVRRPWRRRGLAAALILSACVAVRERGMTEAALGVDAASLTGALGLYERLGFAVHQRATLWRKTLRPGPTEA